MINKKVYQLQRRIFDLQSADKERYVSTGVRLPQHYVHLLRMVATSRADHYGGKVSVSALITKLISLHEKELKAAIENPALFFEGDRRK